MTTTKLKKGPLKVITFAGASTFAENEFRRRANGRLFHPTVRVAVQPVTEGDRPQVVEGFAATLKSGKARYAVNTSPHSWATPRNTPAHCWIETTDEIEVTTSYEE